MARLRRGVHPQLEEEANEILKRGVTERDDRSLILTPSKENLRRRREVLVASGTPDPSIRKGMYHREMNPRQTHLNSRDGDTRGSRTPPRTSSSADGLRSFIERNI
jgi:hypothetical protein